LRKQNVVRIFATYGQNTAPVAPNPYISSEERGGICDGAFEKIAGGWGSG